MIKTTLTLLVIGTAGIFNVVSDFQQTLPQPVEVCAEDPRLTDTRKTLAILGRNPSFAKDVFTVATAKGYDPVLWACNFEKEAEFKRNAVSKKGYKSFGQTRVAFQKMGYDMADMAAAVCDYDQKLKAAKGNEKLAWAYYKGGDNPEARQNVKELFDLYAKVKAKIKEKA